jgi:hypothetical protein
MPWSCTIIGMKAEADALRREMRVERIVRDDGRVLLLYSWPIPPPDAAGLRLRAAPPIRAWSPEAGPADV